jgi:hypothetical protein
LSIAGGDAPNLNRFAFRNRDAPAAAFVVS